MIERIHHIEITVPTEKVEEARSFYIGFLGLQEIPKPDSLKHRGGFWARLANADLHVGFEGSNHRDYR